MMISDARIPARAMATVQRWALGYGDWAFLTCLCLPRSGRSGWRDTVEGAVASRAGGQGGRERKRGAEIRVREAGGADAE